MQINAGVFNKKIQVIRYEIIKDSDGFETKTEITKDMMIKFKGNVYNITYINDYGFDKKYTEIIAELVVK